MPTLPLAFECTFETNGIGAFNSETDADSKGTVRGYRWLAQHLNRPSAVPYRGAYAYHIDLSGGTNDCYLQEDAGFDTAASGTVALRLYFQAFSLTMASGDAFTIATLQSGAGTDEATIRVQSVSGVIQLVCAETGATAIGASTRQCDLVQGAYHCLELVCTIDSGGGDDGVIQFFVDGYQVGANITALDQGAITQARIGAIGIDAGTTAGQLLFDDIAGDTARVGGLSVRYGERRLLTQTGHFAVGAGSVLWSGVVLSTAVDETVELWDTDTADTTDLSRRLLPVSDRVPTIFTRGLYGVLAGTNPIAEVRLLTTRDMTEGMVYDLGRRG